MTTLLPPNVKVHLALGFIDMRKGIDGLSMLVQGVLHQDPFTGHLFVFRGRTRANLIKIIFWDGSSASTSSSSNCSAISSAAVPNASIYISRKRKYLRPYRRWQKRLKVKS